MNNYVYHFLNFEKVYIEYNIKKVLCHAIVTSRLNYVLSESSVYGEFGETHPTKSCVLLNSTL